MKYANNIIEDKIHEKVYEIINEYATPESRVLDLGSGDDSVTEEIRFKTIYLVDNNFGKLKNGNNISYFEADINSFIDNAITLKEKFDVVIMNEVIEHLSHREKVECLSKMRHILKENGAFVIGYPNCHSLNRLLGVEMGLIPFPEALDVEDRRAGHQMMYDSMAIGHFRTYLDSRRFELIRAEGIMFKPLPNSLMIKHFSEDLDKFVEIGKELGMEACCYIVAVFKLKK